VAEGIFVGAGRHHLASDGRLLLYGLFRRDGVHNSPGNEKFDQGIGDLLRRSWRMSTCRCQRTMPSC